MYLPFIYIEQEELHFCHANKRLETKSQKRSHLMKWLNVNERVNAAPVLGHSGRSWKAIAVTHGPLQQAAPAPSCEWCVDDVHDDGVWWCWWSRRWCGWGLYGWCLIVHCWCIDGVLMVWMVYWWCMDVYWWFDGVWMVLWWCGWCIVSVWMVFWWCVDDELMVCGCCIDVVDGVLMM